MKNAIAKAYTQIKLYYGMYFQQQDLFSEVFYVPILYFWISVIFVDHIVVNIFR